MSEVDGEIWNLPQRLHAVLAEHDLRVLDAEAGEIGAVAAPRPLEYLGDGAGHVELAASRCRHRQRRALGDDALAAGRRILRDGAPHDRLGIAARGAIEAERETIVGGVEQKARADEVDAAGGEAPGEKRRAAHADSCERRLRHDRTVAVDETDIAQPEQHARTVRRALQDRIVDLHMHVRELLVDRLFGAVDEARE